jgi:glycine/D-amino acid oxidase-like deaminating enzyme
MNYDIVIIGAGVMGAAAACEVAREGATVVLLDQDDRSESARGVDRPFKSISLRLSGSVLRATGG